MALYSTEGEIELAICEIKGIIKQIKNEGVRNDMTSKLRTAFTNLLNEIEGKVNFNDLNKEITHLKAKFDENNFIVNSWDLSTADFKIVN